MPFRSDSQRRFLYAKHPEIAQRWSMEEKNMEDGKHMVPGMPPEEVQGMEKKKSKMKAVKRALKKRK